MRSKQRQFNQVGGIRTMPGLRSIAARFAGFLVFSVVLMALSAPAFGVNFTATLDRESVTVGESVTLTLQFEGGTPRAVPVPPQIANLQMADTGQSQNTTIIQGRISYTYSQTFALSPTQPGDYSIPALSAEINGQTFTSPPLKFKAVKAEASTADKNGDPLAVLKIFAPRKEVYVGEVVSVEFQVCIRDGVANAEQICRYFESFNGSPIKAEGCSVLKTAHAQRRRTRIGNSNYNVATLVTSLAAVKTGNINLTSIDVTLPLQLPSPNQRRRDPLWDMMMGAQVEEKRVALTADAETLNALTLPKENVPANFNGAVGNYQMAVNAGPTNVAVGDPVTVKVQISGRGALDALSLPEQAAWHDFKSYPPTAKVDTTDPLGLQGMKTFEQIIVPQSTDIKQVPPVTFSFFDPDQKGYRTLTQPAIDLIVRPGAAASAPTIAAPARDSSDAAANTPDIVHIKPRLGMTAQLSAPLVTKSWFLALQGLPVIAFIASVVARRRAESYANNPRLRRERQVAQFMRDGLVELRRSAGENNSEQFFATLFRLLQEQLGERLNLPATAITEAVIDEKMRPRGVDESVLAPLHELFQTCNLARYAPIKSSQEFEAVIAKLETAISAVRELKL